jgi:hypothetical protein
LPLLAASPPLAPLGDRFPLQPSYDRLTLRNAAQLFGATPFTKALFESPLQQWAGPFESGYGWHLLFVTELGSAELPAFDDIEAQVARVYRDAMQRGAAERAFDTQKQRYRISRSN